MNTFCSISIATFGMVLLGSGVFAQNMQTEPAPPETAPAGSAASLLDANSPNGGLQVGIEDVDWQQGDRPQDTFTLRQEATPIILSNPEDYEGQGVEVRFDLTDLSETRENQE